MLCPFCGENETKVNDSRLVGEGRQVRRRRECLKWSERFTTFETAELVLPRMIKSNGTRQPFDEEKLNRQLNVGFSGGEKKKNEILQMSMLSPKLSILDETDSGLDIDALRIVADGVNTLRNEKNSFLIITHYQRLLDYIKPDFVHVLMNGKIVKSGGPDLALELEKKGYESFN